MRLYFPYFVHGKFLHHSLCCLPQIHGSGQSQSSINDGHKGTAKLFIKAMYVLYKSFLNVSVLIFCCLYVVNKCFFLFVVVAKL